MKQRKTTNPFWATQLVEKTYTVFNLENHFELQLLPFTLSFPSELILFPWEHFIHGINWRVCVWAKPRKNRSRLQIVYLLVTQVQPAGRSHGRGEVTSLRWVGVYLCSPSIAACPRNIFISRRFGEDKSIPKLTWNAQKDTLPFCVNVKM